MGQVSRFPMHKEIGGALMHPVAGSIVFGMKSVWIWLDSFELEICWVNDRHFECGVVVYTGCVKAFFWLSCMSFAWVIKRKYIKHRCKSLRNSIKENRDEGDQHPLPHHYWCVCNECEQYNNPYCVPLQRPSPVRTWRYSEMKTGWYRTRVLNRDSQTLKVRWYMCIWELSFMFAHKLKILVW